MKKFEEQNKRVKRAVRKLLEEAEQISTGEKTAASFKDIFGQEG